MLDPALGYLIIGGIAILFASAGVHKLPDLAHFTEILAAYRLLPNEPARLLAGLIPWLELIDAQGVLRARGIVNSREQLGSLFEAKRTGFASIQDYFEAAAQNRAA